jgi:type IV fimbrial biogenesis protein FimT
MRPVKAPAPGFTLIEALITMVIMAVVLAVGVPTMNGWISRARAASAAEFYAAGLRRAHDEALNRHSRSRLVLTENIVSGQYDWQVDVCFPSAGPCSNSTGSWSTVAAPATGDPEGSSGFRSVRQTADALPSDAVVTVTRLPSDALEVYFLESGWLDASLAPTLRRLTVGPSITHAGQYPDTALVLSLAGTLSRCDPSLSAGDSRACPPP